MATQAQAMPLPRWEKSKATSGGIFSQIITLFAHPKKFFEQMPQTRSWVLVALLILGIAGYSATNQAAQSQTSTAATSRQTQGFNTSIFQQGTSGAAGQTGASAASTQTAPGAAASTGATAGNTAATTAANTTTAAVDTNTTLMTALLSASGILLMWAGQAILLSLVTMLQGYAPSIGRSAQIAVWASLPLAVMLILRQVNFAMGGTGGSVGLSLLLTQWNGFAALPQLSQHIVTVFMSNISLFWIWNLVLLYLGARYALSGNRLAVVLVMIMWIVSAAVVPAVAGNPVTTVGPRSTTSSASTQRTTNTTTGSTPSTTGAANQAGGFAGGNFPGGGNPPSAPGGTRAGAGATNRGG